MTHTIRADKMAFTLSEVFGGTGDYAKLQSSLQPQIATQNKERAIAALKGLAMMGLGTGAGVAALPELSSQLSAMMGGRPEDDETLNLPQQVVVPKVKQSGLMDSTGKTLNNVADWLTSKGTDLRNAANQAGDRVQQFFQSVGQPGAGSVGAGMVDNAADWAVNKGRQFFSGELASNFATQPWFLPAATMTGVGSVATGYHLQKALQKHLKDRAHKAELEKAKQDYLAALAGGVKTAAEATTPQEKLAAELHADLDAAYDQAAKQANMADVLGSSLGILGTLAVLGGVSGYPVGKGIADKFQKRRVLEEAQKYRRRRKFLRRPSPILAVSPEDSGEAVPAAEAFVAAPSLG